MRVVSDAGSDFTSLPAVRFLCLTLLLATGCGDKGSISQAPGSPSNPTVGSTASSTTVSVSPAAVTEGTPIALAATVAPGSASGSVSFLDSGGTKLGLSQLSSSKASLQVATSSGSSSALGLGTHFLSATYNGDSTYAVSTSPSVEASVSASGATCGLGLATKTFSSGNTTEAGSSYTTTNQNQSAVCAVNNGTSVTLNSPTIRSSGAATSYEDRSGLGAAVLAYGPDASTYTGGAISINGGTLASSGVAAPILFASGKGAIVIASDSTITMTGGTGSSGGNGSVAAGSAVAAARGGAATLNRVTASTISSNAALLAIEGGGGSITTNGGTLTAGDYGAIVRGSGSLQLSHTALTALCAIRIEKDTLDSTSTGEVSVSINSGSVTYAGDNTLPAFLVGSGETAAITLSGVALTSSGSTAHYLMQVAGGTTASLGAVANLTAIGQSASGDIQLIGVSTANISLSDNSQWSGAVSTYGPVQTTFAITLDSTSTWNVTADSVITTLSDDAGISGTSISNIIGNGHTVTYVSSQNAALGEKTYSLKNGGILKPAS
jgi:hypothetical protein